MKPEAALIRTVEVRTERDVSVARRAARLLAERLGLGEVDQTRVATAVSELARNAWRYAGGGRVELGVSSAEPLSFVVRVVDQGPGIPHATEVLEGRYRSQTGMGLGVLGAKRLMDGFELSTTPGAGTAVTVTKRVRSGRTWSVPELAAATSRLELDVSNGEDERSAQSAALVHALAALGERDTELQRLNEELEETNRGVVALHAELEEQAQALRRASELKSRFISQVSHELRTPLNSILSLSRILLQRSDGPLTSEQERQVGYIRSSAESVAELINDLLDLTKIEAGRTELRPRQFALPELVRGLRGLLRPLVPAQEVQLVMDEGEALPALYTDDGKLIQVLRNLLSNALKFTERGEVRLSISRQGGSQIVFAVSDTGVGIAPEHHERVFEEFAQIEGPHQRQKGTGLGLPLARELARLLGGRLELESGLGRGSTFRLVLPAIAPGRRAVPPELAQAWRPELLVIDDDEVARYLLRGLLAALPYRVREASSAAEGLAAARQQPPDAVLLDLVLPDLPVSEVLSALAASPATRSVPVLVHTSKQLTPEEREGLLQRVAFVLSKQELTEALLSERLSSLLRGTGGRQGGLSAAPRGAGEG